MVIRFYMPRLEVNGKTFQLLSDYNHLGSDASQMFHNPIVLNHETIEGKHALLSFNFTKNTTEIADLSTRNGTYLDGQKIPPCEWKLLKHGQKLRFGELKATFLADPPVDYDQSSQDSDHLEDYRAVQIHEEPKSKTIVAATQEETSIEYSMADVSLPETQFPGGSDWDEDDAALAALPDSALSPRTPEKRLKRSIPETPDDPETDRSSHDHVMLPETQSRPTSRASSVISPQNFNSEDFCNLSTQIFNTQVLENESQNLLADVQLPIQRIKPIEKLKEVKEVPVMKKNDPVEISGHLKILSEGDDTDCEDELAPREGSKTPELEELDKTEKAPPFRHPNVLMAPPQQAFIKLRRLQVPENKNPNIYEAETEADECEAPQQAFIKLRRLQMPENRNPNIYEAETQADECEAPQQAFIKPRKLQMPKNQNPNIYGAETQADECEAPTQRFEPEATQKFDLEAFKRELEQQKRSECLSQMRLSDFSEDLSQSSQSSTPPCAIKMPSGQRIHEILKARVATKRAATSRLFPESSDEEDEDFQVVILGETPAKKTPAKKMLMSQRLRQINILDSPCPESLIESIPSKPSTSPAKRNLLENGLKAPQVLGSWDSEMLYRESPPHEHETVSSEYFPLPEMFSYPAPAKDEALLIRHLAESVWERFSKVGSTSSAKISRRA